MKLRSPLVASAIGVLIAAAHAVPAYAEHDTNSLDKTSTPRAETSETITVGNDELADPTPPSESAEPTAPKPTDPIDPPAKADPQAPLDPKQSPIPKTPTDPVQPTAPVPPKNPAHPTETTKPLTPVESPKLSVPIHPSEPSAPKTPPPPWEAISSEDPTELHTPTAPMGLTDPEVSAPPASTTESPERVAPSAPTDPEAAEEPGVHSGTVTYYFGQPVILDVGDGTFREDATPKVWGELLTESVPWDHPQGVVPTASPVETTEHSLAQAGSISSTLFIGGALLLAAGAVLLMWGRRADQERASALELESPES
ncbi:hypothetical protein GCM10023190_22330 [Enteractinococcus fodinae]|uniref:LPXTG cell wall anchor domain-containing protein n=1 Tax=Enteractinococcus fodinae TaxID=684663 RepID=A0ABU2B3P5_9MICC|nr:hypothetical protein [Enteractinococcus fodinae]MDR7348011.1 hypothetical protein [Enteractinococcus fodinae]